MSSKIIASTSSGTALNMSADTSGILEIQTGATPTTAITVTAAQLVGVGTASPTNTLQVAGGISATGSAPAFQASAAIMDVSAGVARFNATGADNSTNGTMTFNTASANAGVFNERMRINSAGNVGIGETSIASDTRLHLKQTADNCILKVQSSFSPILHLINGGGSEVSTINATGNNVLTFQTGSSERMRIDSSGNLLVGTTTTTLNPTGGFNLWYNSGSTVLGMGHISGTPSGNSYQIFSFNGSTIGTINQSGTTAVSYNTSSDYRLKEDVAPMTNALATVSALKPVTYKWKSDGSAGQGFIAHELQAVVPDAVTGEKDAVKEDGSILPQGIDTSFLVATLTAAIQEQQALITDLTTRLAALEGAK
jgi:hypothetical protein